MNTPEDMPPQETLARRASNGADGGQRFGRVTSWPTAGRGPGSRADTYVVCTDDRVVTCSFDNADIVTEGFRAIRTGERVRFLTDRADPWPRHLRDPPRPPRRRGVLQIAEVSFAPMRPCPDVLNLGRDLKSDIATASSPDSPLHNVTTANYRDGHSGDRSNNDA